MLINTTLKTIGSLLGIGPVNGPVAATATTPAATPAGSSGSPSPPQAAAAAPLPPLGEAARFDFSPGAVPATQPPAATVAGGAVTAAGPTLTTGARVTEDVAAGMRAATARPAAVDPGDEAAARAWAIRAQADETSLDMIIRIAKLTDRPWPTDKAVEAARQADEAATERKTLAVA